MEGMKHASTYGFVVGAAIRDLHDAVVRAIREFGPTAAPTKA
jgi:hypothetical protein